MYTSGQPDNSAGKEVFLGECLDIIEEFIRKNIILEIFTSERTKRWNDLVRTDGKNNPIIPIVEDTVDILILLRDLLEAYLKDIESRRGKSYREIRDSVGEYLNGDIDSASVNTASDRCSAVNICIQTKEYDRIPGYLRSLMGDLRQIVSCFSEIKKFPDIESLSGVRKQLNSPATKELLQKLLESIES